jgi:ATP-binding cassette, subfamily B (MDR/TAP), member 1
VPPLYGSHNITGSTNYQLEKSSKPKWEKTVNMATGESSLAPAVAEQETLQENSTSGPATKSGKSPLRPYLRLLREATLPDHILRCIGLLSAIAFGAAMPLMTIVFGHMVDDLNSWGSGDSNVAALVDNGSRNALWLTWLFLGCFACVFISVLCLRITALRSSTSLRLRFIRALISQDIQYMDSCSAGTVGTLVSTNAELVEGGIGERITVFVSGLSMLFSAFVVAFVQSWKLTLVVALGIPLSAIAAGFAVIADSKINAKVYEIYAQAAGLAEEALSTTKIVAAFGASGKLQKKYDQYLRLARRLSIKQGPLRAMQFSVVMATTYLSYGMAWFYGTHLLSTGGVSSGGKIIVYDSSWTTEPD